MKKFFTIFAAIALVLSMSSCGDMMGNGNGDSNGNNNNNGNPGTTMTDNSDRETDIIGGNSNGGAGADGEGNTNDTTDGEGGAEGILQAVWDEYADDEKFASVGGDGENAVSDGPGSFGMDDAESLDAMLGLPGELTDKVTDTATLMHMMNANTFTSACYKLKSGTDVKEFSDALEKNVMARQWICGTPETLLVMNVNDEYIISAFGADDLIQTFKTNSMKAIDTISVVTEAPVVEGGS